MIIKEKLPCLYTPGFFTAFKGVNTGKSTPFIPFVFPNCKIVFLPYKQLELSEDLTIAPL